LSGRSDRPRDLTRDAFERLLALLDSDRDRAGDRYERVRFKLVRFFEWRGSAFPEELADRTIDRVCRKITEGSEILEDPSGYFYGVARNILKESWDDQRRRRDAVNQSAASQRTLLAAEPPFAAERRFQCLDQCLAKLPPSARDALLRYYEGEGRAKIANRLTIAREEAMSIASLRLRMSRLRGRLQKCVGICLAQAVLRDRNRPISPVSNENDS
jgi:DNA-directed RNA polymerase specialized sigma24 family protein